MKIDQLLDAQGIITKEAMEALKLKSTSVSCECPDRLIKLLELVKDLTEYQDNCIIEKPSDELTHKSK